MIRAATSLRCLHRCSGTTSRVSANVHSGNLVNGIKNHSPFLFPSAREFGSTTTTKCDDEIALSDATPAPPSFDETMSKLFLESSEKVEAVVAAAWEPTWWPSDRILLLLNYVQETTGSQLAIAIIGTTASIRILLFPLFVKAQRNQSRMAHLSPELTALKAKMDTKGRNITQEEQMKLGTQMQSLFKKYGVHPATSLLIPFIQMPIFMGMFFALRKMPDIFPNEMIQGGMLWFPDLSIPDPYFVLPVMASASFMLSIEANKEQMLSTNVGQGTLMINVFRAFGLIMIPSISYFSAGLNCYWVTNNTATLLQTILFKSAAVRKALGIWDPPKPVPGAPRLKGIVETAKEGITNLIEGKKSLTPTEEIEVHNRKVDEQKYFSMIGKSSRERRMTARRKAKLTPTKG